MKTDYLITDNIMIKKEVFETQDSHENTHDSIPPAERKLVERKEASIQILVRLLIRFLLMVENVKFHPRGEFMLVSKNNFEKG